MATLPRLKSRVRTPSPAPNFSSSLFLYTNYTLVELQKIQILNPNKKNNLDNNYKNVICILKESLNNYNYLVKKYIIK